MFSVAAVYVKCLFRGIPGYPAVFDALENFRRKVRIPRALVPT
jgi:hypothetical protein